MKINLFQSIYKNVLEFLTNQDPYFKHESGRSEDVAKAIGLDVNDSTIQSNILQRDLNRLLDKYYFYQKRHIPIQKWTVKTAANMNCPDDLKGYYDSFKEKAEKGEDLNPYLSKKTERIDECDKLLSHWGIYHFHLGELKEGEKFVSRSRPVLFAKIFENTIFLINVLQHGAWNRFELIETVCREFPESMKQYILNGVMHPEPIIKSEEDIKKLRACNINTIIEVDGVCYSKFGVMSDGTDGECKIKADLECKKLKNLEEYLVKNEEKIKKCLNTNNEITIETEYDETEQNKIKIFVKANGHVIWKIEY